MNSLHDKKIQFVLIRSKANSIEADERNTKYFLILENQTSNIIKELKPSNGVHRKYYKLYSKRMKTIKWSTLRELINYDNNTFI